MQKWIGVGRIDGEPINIKYDEKDAILMWVNIPRNWRPRENDNVPLIFVGKRAEALKQAGVSTYSGALVYVMGEISSRIKVYNKREINIGCAVFVTSIEFWDMEHIESFTKGKPNNEQILMVKEEI